MIFLLPIILVALLAPTAQAFDFMSGGFEMWPTSIDAVAVDVAGVKSPLRFYRAEAAYSWHTDYLGVPFEIEWNGIDFDLFENSVSVGTLPDRFWRDSTFFVAWQGGNGELRILGSEVDHFRPDVAWLPVFVGFVSAMFADFIMGMYRLILGGAIGRFLRGV